jgi:hypothetical protein
MSKNIKFFIVVCIILALIYIPLIFNPVSAQEEENITINETTPIPTPTPTKTPIYTPIIEWVTESFYGEAYYYDRAPIPAGTEIIAKDQFGSPLGKYKLKTSGKFGGTFSYSENFIVGLWRNQSDKANRTRTTYISFFVNGVQSSNTMVEFKANELTNLNIVLPIVAPTPVATPAPPLPSSTPMTPTTATVAPIQVTNPPTQPPQPTSSTPSNELPFEVVVGGIVAFIVISGIVIVGSIHIILTNISSRDDVIQPKIDKREIKVPVKELPQRIIKEPPVKNIKPIKELDDFVEPQIKITKDPLEELYEKQTNELIKNMVEPPSELERILKRISNRPDDKKEPQKDSIEEICEKLAKEPSDEPDQNDWM